MTKSVNILDKDYLHWVKELSCRYRQSQTKAAVKVNSVLIEFYWELGHDIVSLGAENKYGGKFYTTLSTDLRKEMPGIKGLSESNIRYAKRFFQLYSDISQNLQQVVEELCSVPWGHHRSIIDKFSESPKKALFYPNPGKRMEQSHASKLSGYRLVRATRKSRNQLSAKSPDDYERPGPGNHQRPLQFRFLMYAERI